MVLSQLSRRFFSSKNPTVFINYVKRIRRYDASEGAQM